LLGSEGAFDCNLGPVGRSEFLRLFRSMNSATAIAASITKIGTPTPIPTLAPVEIPLLLGLLDVGAALDADDDRWVVDNDGKSVA
jgi:hypothetical protein